MPTVAIHKIDGTKTNQTIDLPAEMWEVPTQERLVHQAVVAFTANRRENVAHTKTRAEVRGGGRKPWRQKGTGNARHGSIRSPLWRGGGITFGPRHDRNFSVSMNKKAKKKALFMVLSNKLASQKLVVIDEFAFAGPKTNLVADMLQKLPTKGAKATLILNKDNAALARAVRNLPRAGALAANSLNVYELLRREWLVVPQAALKEMEATYLS